MRWSWLHLGSSVNRHSGLSLLSRNLLIWFLWKSIWVATLSLLLVDDWCLVLLIGEFWQKAGMINGGRDSLDIFVWYHCPFNRPNRFLTCIFFKYPHMQDKCAYSEKVPKGKQFHPLNHYSFIPVSNSF
jgi:hypothetical protein